MTDEEARAERELVGRVFSELLKSATGDGSAKRIRGEKPPWWRDSGHEAAMYRHLEAFETGERFDPDNHGDPLVAVAWRALALAYQRKYGKVPPV